MGWDYDKTERETRADKAGAAIIVTIAGAAALASVIAYLSPIARWVAGLF